jgi:hypothetical protein
MPLQKLWNDRSLDDLGHHTGTDGAAAFADRETQTLFHRDRRDQLDRDADDPELTICGGAPNPRSSSTVRPRGPRVTRTARAS